MRKAGTTVIAIIILLSVVSGIHSDYTYGADVKITSQWLDIGASFQFYYFNITLVDISVYGDSAIVLVEGLQGTMQVRITNSTATDVFGDGTIQISLQDTRIIVGTEASAELQVAVDLEALAGVARGLFKEELDEVQSQGLLPDSVVQKYVKTLSTVDEYISSGNFTNAIELSKTSIDELQSLISAAQDALSAINRAEEAISDPATVFDGCEVPEAVLNKARGKLDYAKGAFDSGYFDTAKEYAEKAYNIIYSSCTLCRDYPLRENETRRFLENLTIPIPDLPLKPAWDKLKLAGEAFEAGKCDVANSYLEEAVNISNSILEEWNDVYSCRVELVRMIEEYSRKYAFVYKGEMIKIDLDGILKEIPEAVDKNMKKGYFLTAKDNCNRLKDQVNLTGTAFLNIWGEMNKTAELLDNLSLEGYVVDMAWDRFNVAVEFFRNGSYSSARDEFVAAREIAAQIKTAADEAKSAEKAARECLLELKGQGVNVDALFKADVSKATGLYKSGNYTEAAKAWNAIYASCKNPEIHMVIRQRESIVNFTKQLESEGVVVPRNVTLLLQAAEAYFESGNITRAVEMYGQVKLELEKITSLSRKIIYELNQTAVFLGGNEERADYLVKLLGIPEVRERMQLLWNMSRIVENSYRAGDYSKAAEEVNELRDIRLDIDGDGYPNSSDLLPYIPNYYIFGLAIVLTLLFVHLWR
ncbi:hypothetical protein E3E36_04145 [Thermococcus sp. M36]|uniref:hypothetical protein n=1 Tax=Thermococcus sp. M36 TaxID=1638261 RepID=UPI00143C250D|nr:hypothetical protein [Thermococcus sp. M36]NJE05343.1 hypothetical protein [Thermococcus sp. M36]